MIVSFFVRAVLEDGLQTGAHALTYLTYTQCSLILSLRAHLHTHTHTHTHTHARTYTHTQRHVRAGEMNAHGLKAGNVVITAVT